MMMKTIAKSSEKAPAAPPLRRTLRPKVKPVPQSLLYRSTVSERRRSLMKSVGDRRNRRSSLTIDENKLLLTLSEGELSEGDGNTNHEGESKHVRSKLRKTLNAKRGVLTETEATFIDSIANAADIPVEDLVTVNQVLENDPLYSINSAVFRESDTEPGRRPTLRKDTYDLWKYCATPDGQAFSCRRMKVPDEDEDKQQKTSSTAKPAKGVNTFSYFWKRTFGSVQDEGDEQPGLQETEYSEDDDDLDSFHVLGTDGNDASTGHHVLSPPIMDALRPHMPFAVQHDNFWLKYSMVRDGADLETLLQKCRGFSADSHSY